MKQEHIAKTEGLSAEEESLILERHRRRFGMDHFDERLPPALSDIKLLPSRTVFEHHHGMPGT